MKLSELWEPMSKLRPDQRKISDNAVKFSFVALGLACLAAPIAVQAQRMGGGGYTIPSRPQPAPAPPVQTLPQRPQPAPPTYNPAPNPVPQIPYGTFRVYGPLPEGRVNVRVDGSFEQATIFGYNIWVQDNGAEGNDQMVIDGPAGRESVWINCWVTEEWKSYGPNSEEFIHGVVSTYCDWT